MLICKVQFLLLSNECVIMRDYSNCTTLEWKGEMERKCYTIAEALRYMLLEKQQQHTEDLNKRARNCPQRIHTHLSKNKL